MKLFGATKSVDQIVSQFSVMVKDLEKAQETANKEIDKQNQVIISAEVARTAAAKEAGRASTVAAKIKALIEG